MNLSALRPLFLAGLCLAFSSASQAMVFKSQIIKTHWDNWCYCHNGTYYLYYLSWSPGEGFGVATSTDGVHWDDRGWAIRASERMVDYLGTGAVWKSPDFDKSGKFLCNYSEWRKEKGTGKKTGKYPFRLVEGSGALDQVRRRSHVSGGRPLLRQKGALGLHLRYAWNGGGYWAAWTATGKPGTGRDGTVGVGFSEDGLRWTALPAPQVIPGVGESGAFWKFGDKIHAMFGTAGGMYAYTAEQVVGPYRRTAKNALLLEGGDAYFSRFFPLPDGKVLVNHQEISDWGCYVAPLKLAAVDSQGVMRWKYWPGNDAMKGERVKVEIQEESSAATVVTEPLDFFKGFVAEGVLRLPATKGNRPAGLFLWPTGRGGHAVKAYHDGQVEMGQLDFLGKGWRRERGVNREYPFGATVSFRLLCRRGMLEFYLDDQFMECYHMKGAGGSRKLRFGLLGKPEKSSLDNLKVWAMSLPGCTGASGSSAPGE